MNNVELANMLKSVANMRLCENTDRGRWSAKQHLNAAKILLSLDYEIKSIDQVKNIPKIGNGISRKIEEFLITGKLEELEQNSLADKSKIIALFMEIPGVGYTTADHFYTIGCRSYQDVKIKTKQGLVRLDRIQSIGLSYIDEITKPITRPEMEQITNYIKENVNIVQNGLKVMTVGSFRRGVTTSKDVDILIFPNKDVSIDGILEDLLRLIKEDIIIFQHSENFFMGLISHNDVLKRIDVWVVPYSEIITTLVGRTASLETNKKLRILAKQKKWKLSTHGLYDHNRYRINVRSEDEVFLLLNCSKDYQDNYSLLPNDNE